MFLKKVMDRLFYTCEHNSYLLDRDHLEELPVVPRLRVWMHLRFCKACRRFKIQSDRLEVLLKKYPTSGDTARQTPKMDPKTRDRIREKLKEKRYG